MAEPVAHNLFNEFRKITEPKPVEDKQKDDSDAITTLIGYPGWDKLKEWAEGRLKDIESLNDSLSPTDTPEIIGYRFLAAKTAAVLVREVLNLPEAILKSYELSKETPEDTE